jgi:hypothetical protein
MLLEPCSPGVTSEYEKSLIKLRNSKAKTAELGNCRWRVMNSRRTVPPEMIHHPRDPDADIRGRLPW